MDRVNVYKVLRCDGKKLKSAIIGDDVDVKCKKLWKYGLEYPVGRVLQRRCLAFSTVSRAREWMNSMHYAGCEFELWRADTSGAVRVNYVADVVKLPVVKFKLVMECKDFFGRVVHMEEWQRYVIVNGEKMAVKYFQGVMRCRDIQLIEKVDELKSGLIRWKQ